MTKKDKIDKITQEIQYLSNTVESYRDKIADMNMKIYQLYKELAKVDKESGEV